MASTFAERWIDAQSKPLAYKNHMYVHPSIGDVLCKGVQIGIQECCLLCHGAARVDKDEHISLSVHALVSGLSCCLECIGTPKHQLQGGASFSNFVTLWITTWPVD